MASYGVWKGINAGITNATNTALNIAQLQGQQAHQRAIEADSAARLRMAEEATQREKKLFEYKEQEYLEKEKRGNAWVSVGENAPGLAGMPNLMGHYEKTLKENGYEIRKTADGDTFIQMKAYDFLGEMRNKNLQWMDTEVKAGLQDLEFQSAQITQQIQQLQAAGKSDEKTLAPLVQKRAQIKANISAMIGADSEVQKELEKERLKQEAVMEKERFLEEGRNRRADAQNATTIKAANVRASSKGSTQAKNNTRVYVDTVNGARHVVNLNDPSHKKWLAKYGGQLRPEKDYEKDFSGGDETSGDLTYNPKTGKFE